MPDDPDDLDLGGGYFIANSLDARTDPRHEQHRGLLD
jgi:hypothetical protein